jgi:nicotinamidase-related amidase
MKLIPDEELRTYQKAGFLGTIPAAKRAALIVVDVTYGFTGSRGLTLDEAIREFPTACGPVSWETMPQIAKLIGLFRERGLPVVFTLSDLAGTPFAGNATKSNRKPPQGYNNFPEEITPREGEWVLAKTKASAFFQTPLAAYLIKQGVDTAVVCGVSTSGCVRASVVDAHSNGFTTVVVDDCCFDRSYFAHCANLFDMHAKYASAVSLGDIEELIRPALEVSAA